MVLETLSLIGRMRHAGGHLGAAERRTARLLGTERCPNSGRASADISAGPFSYEHRARKALPAWLLDAVGRARRNAAPGQTPVVLGDLGEGGDEPVPLLLEGGALLGGEGVARGLDGRLAQAVQHPGDLVETPSGV